MSDGVRHASKSEGGALRSNAPGSYRERNADPAASRGRQTRRSLDSLEQPSSVSAWKQSHYTRSDRRSSLDLDRPRLHRHHSPARADASRLRSSPGGSTQQLPSIHNGPLAAMYSSFSGPNTGSEPQGAEAVFRHMHPPNLEDAVKRFVRPTPPAHGGITPTPHDQGGLHSLRYHSMHSSMAGISPAKPTQPSPPGVERSSYSSSAAVHFGADVNRAELQRVAKRNPVTERAKSAGSSGILRSKSGPGAIASASVRNLQSTSAWDGASDPNMWKSLKDIGTSLSVHPRSDEKGGRQSRRSLDEDRAAAMAQMAERPLPGDQEDQHKELFKTLFETWMKLHSKTEEEDEKRRHKYLDRPYVRHSGNREGKPTYGKDHVLVKEAFITPHHLKGEVTDTKYISHHLRRFEEGFDKAYTMLGGAVPWEALQYFGYLFHHVILLAQKSCDAAAGHLMDYEQLHADRVEDERKHAKLLEKMEGMNTKLSDQIIVLEHELQAAKENAESLKEQLHSTRMLMTDGSGTDPLSRLEGLQKQYAKLQKEFSERQQASEAREAELETARKAIRALRSDVQREHNLLRLVEDVLPGRSSLAAEKLQRFSMILSKAQMEILVQAINVGHDPAELYALMMERSVAGDDLHPYISLMGQLRETFDSIHVKAEWGEGFHKGDVCTMEDRPLTKGYLSQLIKSSDSKTLQTRLADSMVQRISLAFNRGLPASTLVQLLDGRMSNKGTCMLSFRALVGALRDHEEFDLGGRSMEILKDASQHCSLTAMLNLQSEKTNLEAQLKAAHSQIEDLEDAIRVRDFKFGKLIGMDINVVEEEEDAAEPWCISDVSKLDEFLARDSADGFRGLGTGSDVPKFLRAQGKIEKRDMSKRETEDLIKDIWDCKEADDHQQPIPLSMQEYIAHFLHMRFRDDAVKMGYNLLHHANKYRHDPDCNVFLQVVDGRVSQDIYAEFSTIMDRLKSFMYVLDYDMHPSGVTATLKVPEIKALLQCYFGDKDNATIETLVAAFQKDVDEQGLNVDEVHYLALFDENENADQGHFASMLKQQHLKERMSLLHDIQEGMVEMCRQENVTVINSRQLAAVIKAIPSMKMTKELTENFMELGLGASWKSGASDTVLNIMKGIRRGRKGGFFRKLSNGQIAAIMNNTRESLGLLRKEEKDYLRRMKDMMIKLDQQHGARFRKELPDTDQLHTLMTRTLHKMTLVLNYKAKSSAAPAPLRAVSQKTMKASDGSQAKHALVGQPKSKSSHALI